MEIKRYDSNSAQITRNDDGSLSSLPVVTRSGIFLYRRADGSTIRELRHPDEVLKADSLDSLKMIPVTNGHPAEFVNAENARSLSVGFTGEDVRVDGALVSVPLKVTTTDGVDAIERGRLQLSLGYSANVIDEAGVYNGQPYDTKQTDIKYNHLAIVDEARAGRVASMRLDGLDAELVENGDHNKNDGGNMDNLAKIRLDKADYEIPVQVESHIAKLDSKITDAGESLAAETKKLDSVQALLDTAIEENKALKADASDENIQKRVDARVALVDSAKTVLGDELKADMSDSDIKKAVILKVMPEAKLDGVSDDYINARHDSAVEMAGKIGVRKQADQIIVNDNADDKYVSRFDAMKNGSHEIKQGSK